MTALLWAARNGAADIVKMILTAGGDLYVRDSVRVVTSLRCCKSVCTNTFRLLFGQVGMTALIWAVRSGSVETTRVILNAGADVHSRDEVQHDKHYII